MSGYGEPNIKFAIETGVQDAGLYSDIEPRIPRDHTAIADYQKDAQDLTASTVTATRLTFKTDKNCDHFERQWLRVKLNPPTVTGGTYKRYVDGVGLHMFDRIELRNGVQLIQTIYPSYDTYLRYMKEMKFESTFKLFPQVGLNLTKAERNSRATAVQDLFIPLDFFWRDDITKDPIVPGIANGLIIDCYLRSAAQIVETDGTAVSYTLFEPPVIRQELVFNDEATRAQKVAMVTGGSSVNYMYDERITVPPFTVPSGTTTTSEIRIEGLNGPMKHLWILVRPATSLADNYANNYCDLSWAYNPDNVRIRANQADIVRPLNLRTFLQPATDSRYYTGLPFAGILLDFSEAPEAVNMASGTLNLSQLTNPTVRLQWLTATTQDYVVELVGYSYNWIEHSGGQFRKIFFP